MSFTNPDGITFIGTVTKQQYKLVTDKNHTIDGTGGRSDSTQK